MRPMDTFIQKIAKEAGNAVLKRFGKDGVHYAKSAHAWDVVTKADLLSEKILISRIKKAYPEHGIIAEESGSVREGAEYVWVIDPIDGTMNFSRGVPLFGVMVCLVRDGDVVLSAINLPATKEFFFARAGGGAYCNGKRIQCSQRKELDQSIGSIASTVRSRTAALLRKLLQAGKEEYVHLSMFGSMASNVCYTACGRRDWAVPLAGSIWDFAPAYLILKESGCKVTDTKGNPWKFGMLEMVAANPRLHKRLLKLTKDI